MPNPTATTPPVKKERCRFELFVRVYKYKKFRFKNGQETFTFRGDRYEKTDHAKMLRTLLNQFSSYHYQGALIILYDNNKPKDDPDREIFRFKNGEFIPRRKDGNDVFHLLHLHTDLLIDYLIPEIFIV